MKPLSYHRCIDGLRGLAVLLVMVCHQTVCLPNSLLERVWISILRIGWIGVDVFFVLSGFLITTILLEQRGSKNYYKNFYARRALRIVPLYYSLLFVFFVIVPLFPSHLLRFLEPLEHSTLWFWGFLTNFLIALRGSSVQPPIAVSWSLSIEEQFYLFWPFIVAKSSFKTLRNVALGIIVFAEGLRIILGLLNVAPISIYVLLFTRADTLAFGALIAIYRFFSPEEFLHLAERWKKPAIIAGALGIFIAVYPGKESMWMYSVGFLCIAIGATSLLTHTLQGHKKLVPFLESAFFVAIGKRSYAMYLLHVPVLGLLVTLFFDPNQFTTPLSRIGAQTLLHASAFLLTYFLSILAYHVVEKHFLKLKRFFASPRKEKANSEAYLLLGTQLRSE